MTTGVRRKLANGREAAPTDLSLLRAFRRALPRVAEDDLGIALGLIGAKQKRLMHAGLSDGLEENWLLLSLSGSSLGLGAACIDPVLVSALVQHQTLGAVGEDIDENRVLTSTDAALAAPLIDAVLAKIRDVSAYGLFRVDRRAQDVRSLILPMEADSFLRAELTVDIACGKYQGQMLFLFPEPPAPKSDEPDRDPAELPVMKDTALVVKAEIRAVLGRLSLPLETLATFRPGQVLPLLDARMSRTELVAIDGRKVATGRLGQADGFRAVRINPVGHKPPPLEASFSAHRRRSPETADGELPDGEDPMLNALSPEDAAVEITELAGLTGAGDGDALPDISELGGSLPDLADLPDLDLSKDPG